MIRVLVCEDEMLVREGLIAILSMEHEINVVGEAVNGREAVEMIASLAPDVVLMDIRMPIMDGLQATRIIAEQYHATNVIILSTHDHEEYVLASMKAGARGYVLKNSAPDELARAIQRVNSGERFIQAAVAIKILLELSQPVLKSSTNPSHEPLTGREIMILTRLSSGMSNRDVADDLKLSEGTVRNYVSNILSKLQVSNRVQAINLARQEEII